MFCRNVDAAYHISNKTSERGLSGMIEKTIQVIRDTEHEAQEIVRQAQSKSQEIIAQAKKEAEQLIETQVGEMKQIVIERTKASQEASAKQQELLLSEIEQEITALKTEVSNKEKEAIQLIIEHLE